MEMGRGQAEECSSHRTAVTECSVDFIVKSHFARLWLDRVSERECAVVVLVSDSSVIWTLQQQKKKACDEDEWEDWRF